MCVCVWVCICVAVWPINQKYADYYKHCVHFVVESVNWERVWHGFPFYVCVCVWICDIINSTYTEELSFLCFQLLRGFHSINECVYLSLSLPVCVTGYFVLKWIRFAVFVVEKRCMTFCMGCGKLAKNHITLYSSIQFIEIICIH